MERRPSSACLQWSAWGSQQCTSCTGWLTHHQLESLSDRTHEMESSFCRLLCQDRSSRERAVSLGQLARDSVSLLQQVRHLPWTLVLHVLVHPDAMVEDFHRLSQYAPQGSHPAPNAGLGIFQHCFLGSQRRAASLHS